MIGKKEAKMSGHETNIVVCGLIHRSGKIFVARRAATKKSFPNRYELIGGHIDPKERLEDALRREIKEELEVEVTVGRIVGAFTYYDEGVTKCEVVYLCQITDALEPKLNPADHSEARWITKGEIGLMEKDDEEIEILRKGFEMLDVTLEKETK
jgi:8-oxo-dGTP pyrophosphatase MutT (NUDIX family)